jgi:hypothetical protein
MGSKGSKRVSKVLTNLSQKYFNNDYIAGKFLKDIKVKNESDQYFVYGSEFRLPETLRANGAPANMDTWVASTSSYRVDEHALKDVITDRDRMNTDAPLQQDRDTTEHLIDKILMRQEFEAQKLLFTTTTFGNNDTLVTATSWLYATTGSVPIQNVLSATGKIIKSAGVRPNTGVGGWDVFEALKENTSIRDRIKYVQRELVTEEILASLFDLDNLYFGSAIYDQAKEGATSSQTTIWGTDFLVAYFAPKPGLKTRTAAANFRVAEKGNPYRVKKWREEDIEGDYIEVQTMFKPKAIATSAAYLFKTVTLA